MTAADPLAGEKRLRRRLLAGAALLPFAGTGLVRSANAARADRAEIAAQTAAPRTISLEHTHTGEAIDLVYAVGGEFDRRALTNLNRFLRDHYNGEVGNIDPRLFDLLHALRSSVGVERPFQVISGYRSPSTNARLRSTRGGGVATRSLHMDGMAIDVRLPGAALPDLRDAALSLAQGGVGFYPREQFVHVDTGRVRRW
jgi:uncharacterized protein YcbK (DUF882 family)